MYIDFKEIEIGAISWGSSRHRDQITKYDGKITKFVETMRNPKWKLYRLLRRTLPVGCQKNWCRVKDVASRHSNNRTELDQDVGF